MPLMRKFGLSIFRVDELLREGEGEECNVIELEDCDVAEETNNDDAEWLAEEV